MLAQSGVDSISRDSPTEDFLAPLCLHLSLSSRAQSLAGIVWSGVRCIFLDDEPLFEDEWIGNLTKQENGCANALRLSRVALIPLLLCLFGTVLGVIPTRERRTIILSLAIKNSYSFHSIRGLEFRFH